MTEAPSWRRCSACKGPIALGARYWTCNVSTCNQKRTGLVFCTVTCWEVHLPGANHRESWAVEQTAPATSEEASNTSSAPPRGGKRRLVRSDSGESGGTPAQDVLIVASRLKNYVRSKAGFNTSDAALAPLSDIVRRACDEAIANARREGRMTILDRDVPDA